MDTRKADASAWEQFLFAGALVSRAVSTHAGGDRLRSRLQGRTRQLRHRVFSLRCCGPPDSADSIAMSNSYDLKLLIDPATEILDPEHGVYAVIDLVQAPQQVRASGAARLDRDELRPSGRESRGHRNEVSILLSSWLSASSWKTSKSTSSERWTTGEEWPVRPVNYRHLATQSDGGAWIATPAASPNECRWHTDLLQPRHCRRSQHPRLVSACRRVMIPLPDGIVSEPPVDQGELSQMRPQPHRPDSAWTRQRQQGSVVLSQPRCQGIEQRALKSSWMGITIAMY
jgi:hypothetical protein